MRRVYWIVAAALFVVLSFVISLRADNDTTTLIGKAAPDISLSTVDGQSVTLSNEKGKVVLLDFWATWCGPCVESLPHIQHLSADKDRAAKGLMVWAINNAEDKNTIQKFLKENNYTFTVPMDTAGMAMQHYLATGIPTTVVIGRDGTIKTAFVGFGPGVSDSIEAAIDKALAEAAK